MTQRTKKQHHTPRFYLDAFAAGTANHRSLWVFDRKEKKWFQSSPSNIGCVNDFYDVDIEDNRNIIEELYSKNESIAAPIIRAVLESREIPSDRQERGELLNFIGLQALRGEAIRSSMSDFKVLTAKIIFERLAANPKSLKNTLLAIGTDPSELEETAAKIADGIKNEHYRFVPAKEGLIESVLKLTDPMYELMWERKWEIIVPESLKTQFITSDNPVVLTNLALSGNEEEYLINRVGFGASGSSVIFALSPNFALHGLFGGIENRVLADDLLVRVVNGRIINQAVRQIYSSQKDICIEVNNCPTKSFNKYLEINCRREKS